MKKLLLNLVPLAIAIVAANTTHASVRRIMTYAENGRQISSYTETGQAICSASARIRIDSRTEEAFETFETCWLDGVDKTEDLYAISPEDGYASQTYLSRCLSKSQAEDWILSYQCNWMLQVIYAELDNVFPYYIIYNQSNAQLNFWVNTGHVTTNTYFPY